MATMARTMVRGGGRAVLRFPPPPPPRERSFEWRRRFCSSSDEQQQQQQHWTCLRNAHNGAEVFLLGTCHVSSDSANHVTEMIRRIKPHAIALELCPARAQQLRSGDAFQTLCPTDLFKVPGWLGKRTFAHVIEPLRELLKIFGLNYGEEFRVAMVEAEILGSQIHYIDRDINVTLNEVKSSLSFPEISRFLGSFPEMEKKYSALFDVFRDDGRQQGIMALMNNRKALQQMLELIETYFPAAVKAILHDRNEVMVQRLRKIEGKVVAVVGLGHLEGMQKLWHEAET